MWPVRKSQRHVHTPGFATYQLCDHQHSPYLSLNFNILMYIPENINCKVAMTKTQGVRVGAGTSQTEKVCVEY